MNNTDNNQIDNQTVITDLPAKDSEVEEIKGGPKKIFIGRLSVTGQQVQLGDLEPNGEVRGGTKMPSPTTPISGPKPTSK